jgi:hypothetical protein
MGIGTYPAIMTGLQKIDVTEGRFGVVVTMVRCWSFTSEKLGLAQKMTKHFNLKHQKPLKCRPVDSNISPLQQEMKWRSETTGMPIGHW